MKKELELSLAISELECGGSRITAKEAEAIYEHIEHLREKVEKYDALAKTLRELLDVTPFHRLQCKCLDGPQYVCNCYLGEVRKKAKELIK